MKTKLELPKPQTPFAASLNLLLSKQEWGAAAALARKVGVSPPYISELAAGRKDGKEDKRRAIAVAFGHTYDQFLELGELLLAGHAPETVALYAGVLRANKTPSECSPEEYAALEECLGPRLREFGAALQARVEKQRDELARNLASRFRRLGVTNVEPAALPERSRRVPVISFVQAGEWTLAAGVEPGEAEDWIESSVGGARVFALRVKGDSMEPVFREGEIILVDPDREAVNGDYVVAALEREEATLKRWERVGGRDLLIPLNPRYQPIDVTGQDWRVIGRVLEKRQIF